MNHTNWVPSIFGGFGLLDWSFTRPTNATACEGAVTYSMSGGQFDSGWLPARAPHGGASCVWWAQQTKVTTHPKVLPFLPAGLHEPADAALLPASMHEAVGDGAREVARHEGHRVPGHAVVKAACAPSVLEYPLVMVVKGSVEQWAAEGTVHLWPAGEPVDPSQRQRARHSCWDTSLHTAAKSSKER